MLTCGSPVIAHEVILSVQRLVKKYGKDLTNSAWDIILDILETILKQIEVVGDITYEPCHEISTMWYVQQAKPQISLRLQAV